MSEAKDNLMLKDRYDLHKAPEVKAAAERTRARSGEKVPQDPADQIQNYLDRVNSIVKREDPQGRERGINALKRLASDKFITRYKDIPDSYWKTEERIIRERGQQADYESLNQEDKEVRRRELTEGLLDDQRESLNSWIDYLVSEDTDYMPDYIKYWVFRSVVGLQEYNKEKKQFPKRSKGTLKMFPDLNREALAYVIDAVLKKQEGSPLSFGDFEYDLTDEQKMHFRKNLESENFGKLYAWANEQIKPIPDHLLPVTEGEWIKYKQGSDHAILVASIRGRGTGWCTAGENTAIKHLKGGDFHVFYSNDEKDEATIPRIAIRMQSGSIAEVRGIASSQNLDPFMGDVLEEKLEQFPDKEEYLKKERDMKRLTEIDKKINNEVNLTQEDLLFLYEIDSSIEGFGYSRDPRIQELRNMRNLDEDLLVVFDCEPSEVAQVPSEINENTKAYVGPLEQGVLKTLYKYGIEHVYTSFPEGRVRFEKVKVGGKSRSELHNEFRNRDSEFIDVSYLLDDVNFTPQIDEEEINLVRLSVGSLFSGFDRLTDSADINQIRRHVAGGLPNTKAVYAMAEKLGLNLCPVEVGPYFRLQYKDQPMNEIVNVGHRPFVVEDSVMYPDAEEEEIVSKKIILQVKNTEDFGELELGHDLAEDYVVWHSQQQFIFRIE